MKCVQTDNNNHDGPVSELFVKYKSIPDRHEVATYKEEVLDYFNAEDYEPRIRKLHAEYTLINSEIVEAEKQVTREKLLQQLADLDK